MLKISTGRLKTYVLSVLIISSFILVGSLWFEDYHGLSIFFTKISDFTFASLMNIGKDDMQSKYDKIFVPSKIIVNNGEEGHWIIYPTQQSGDKLWKTAKGLLEDISDSGTELKLNYVEESEWNALILKRSIIINFDYPLSSEILAVLLKPEKKKVSDDIVNIDKMAITTLGGNLIFYLEKIKDGKNVYGKYSFAGQNTIDDKDFEKIFADTGLIKYTLLKEALENMKLELTYKDDVFVPIFSFAESKKKVVNLKKVEFAPDISLEQSDEINKLVEKIFEGTDFSKFIKNDGTHIFIDEKNNTLKVYPNGFVELEYMKDEGINSQETDFESAVKIAIATTEKFGGSNKLYIADEQGSKGQYQFKFDYIINGVPVVFSKAGKPSEISSAIVVTINKEQLKFQGFILNFKVLESEQKFSSDHDSIINAVFEDAGKNAKKISINDIKLAYKLNSGEKATELPVWLVKYKVDEKEKLIMVKASEDR